ncbi:hypothetical protein A2V80_00730 [Candidatus Woesebacteria bacterium RBG_16_39_8b]|uniref:Putative pre-16S rRNA nuclease n=1 Tax=Candidatus Woesebacteria bacterium RBG_16_39_8b TaxID=1802482 RepID=A0A1F7XHK5_9BACT|nr:MAG: hypothetical protein A2V80_00730 [Candidatus Woesebacteria bacterium RBG_16_39_8b]
MRILAIDYGRKKIGLAVGDTETRFAEPHSVIKFNTPEEAIDKVAKVSRVSKVSRAVLGISEGKMAEETKEFGEKLKEELKIPVVYQDETLTTNEAQVLSIDAGIKRKKRRALEDAYSATLILQSYLDLRKR